MLKLKVKDVPKFLKIAYAKRMPVMLHGAPGIGKSSVVKQTAKELGIACNDHVRLSQLDPVDLGGIPTIEDCDGEKVMGRAYPAWLPRSGAGLLFLDEINKGMPSTQAAAYSLVLDRALGEAKLGDGWMIVAAGNRSTDRATVYEMDAPLQNRFPMHIEVETPTSEELLAYFESIGKTHLGVAGFLQFKPSRVWHLEDRSTDPAWASPRSWEFLMDLLSEVPSTGTKASRDALTKDLAVAAVGDVVGREFAAFLRLSEEVDIKAILEKPELFAQIERPDIRHSVITEIASLYQKNAKLEGACKEIVFSCVQTPELVMLAIATFHRANKSFVRKVLQDPRADALAEHMQKFL
jgi:MoxR-like ATPase